MNLNRAAVTICLTLFVTSCGPSDFAGGGGEGVSDTSCRYWQQGDHFYTAFWSEDAEHPDVLLVARVPVKTRAWGAFSITAYQDGEKVGTKFELKDNAHAKSWAIYDVVPESSKESLVLADQSYDLKTGRVFLLDATTASNNVVQIDAKIPDMPRAGDPKSASGDLPGAFGTLAQTNQTVKDFLQIDQ